MQGMELDLESRNPVFCPPVEEPEREAGPAAMNGPPPAGKQASWLYVVVVNAGGAPKGRERSNPRRYMGLEVHDSEHGDAMDSPQRRDWYPRKQGWRVLTHDPMPNPKRSATPRIGYRAYES